MQSAVCLTLFLFFFAHAAYLPPPAPGYKPPESAGYTCESIHHAGALCVAVELCT